MSLERKMPEEKNDNPRNIYLKEEIKLLNYKIKVNAPISFSDYAPVEVVFGIKPGSPHYKQEQEKEKNRKKYADEINYLKKQLI